MKLHTIGRHALVEGDCIETLRVMPADSFDACVTDPPYGLGFMGKAWDCDVPGADFAAELLRVLKPGAHACLFGGTRTFHRLAVALEDAGFEVRDCLSWLYGTGFPKSLDVSKAIDAAAGATREVIGERRRPATGRLQTSGGYEFAETFDVTTPATPEASRWNGWGTALKPAVENVIVVTKPLDAEGERGATLRSLIVLESRLCLLSSVSRAAFDSTSSHAVSSEELDSARWTVAELRNTWVALSGLTDTWRFVSALNTCSSTVTSWRNTLVDVSKRESMFTTETASSLTTDWKTLNFCVSRITPATIIQAAIQVPGSWWTADPAANALSVAVANIDSTRGRSVLEAATSEARAQRLAGVDPAVDWEPIVLVRKPLIGTVADNVLAHGTGGLNIDAARIETSDNLNGGAYSGSGERHGTSYTLGRKGGAEYVQPEGRWPANVVLDEVAAELLDAQAGERTSGANPTRRASPKFQTAYGAFEGREECIPARGADSGGASRFFYCAKPSRAERDRGCDHLPARTGGEAVDREDGAPGTQSPRVGAGRTGGARNIHPTVKPAVLIRWLVKLITPPGGVVLDPFAGSGTIFLAAEGLDVVVNACEREPEYVQIALARAASANP